MALEKMESSVQLLLLVLLSGLMLVCRIAEGDTHYYDFVVSYAFGTALVNLINGSFLPAFLIFMDLVCYLFLFFLIYSYSSILLVVL